MKSIDKGDVDISKLFEWSGKFNIQDKMGSSLIDVYIRLAGDAEVNRARVYGLRKSAELRRKLRTKDSDERLAYIPDIDSADKELFIENIILYESRDLANQALNDIRPPLPTEPKSGASLERQEQYQAEVDKYPEKLDKDIRKYVEKHISGRRDDLLKKTKEEVYKIYETHRINEVCEVEMIMKFREMSAYFGTYLDKDFTRKLTESFEEFENLPTVIKDQIVEDYLSLEIGGEDLKKLLEVTQ